MGRMAARVDSTRMHHTSGPDLTERSRDRILAAALEEFANRGYDGTTTAEIARTASVTQPLVHYHFASKDILWRTAVEGAFERAVSSFDGVMGELADLELIDQMKVLVRRFVRFSAMHPELGRIISYEGVRGGPRLTWLIEHHMAGQFDGFEVLYERAVVEGAVKPLPVEHVVTSLAAAISYLFIVRAAMAEIHGLDVTDDGVVETHADTIVELFFHGIVRLDEKVTS